MSVGILSRLNKRRIQGVIKFHTSFRTSQLTFNRLTVVDLSVYLTLRWSPNFFFLLLKALKRAHPDQENDSKSGGKTHWRSFHPVIERTSFQFKTETSWRRKSNTLFSPIEPKGLWTWKVFTIVCHQMFWLWVADTGCRQVQHYDYMT